MWEKVNHSLLIYNDDYKIEFEKCKIVYLLFPPMPNPWKLLEIIVIVGSSIVFENHKQCQTFWRNVTFLGFDLSVFTTVYTFNMFLLRLFFSWVLHIRELFSLLHFLSAGVSFVKFLKRRVKTLHTLENVKDKIICYRLN